MSGEDSVVEDLRFPFQAAGQALLSWYEENKRELPWRGLLDPYAIWVSEILLQQTTVGAVLGRYENFLERFPTVLSLAEASEQEVLAELQGLGYYRRFRAMKKAADTIVEQHDGVLPHDYQGWKSLPGIGEYTAGAITSIAFNEPEAAVDGNVVRVITRLLAIPGLFETPARKRKIGDLVLKLMPEKSASAFNQALFDLGATICSPTSPKCDLCPMRSSCRAFEQDGVALYPEKPVKKKLLDVDVTVAFVLSKGRVLMHTRPQDASRMPGFREMPEVWSHSEENGRESLLRHLQEQGCTQVILKDEVAQVRHTITHHRLRCSLLSCSLNLAQEDGWQWVDRHDLAQSPTSTITKKLLKKLP